MATAADAPPAVARHFTTGSLAKATDAEYALLTLTVPKTTRPTSLADFGYFFNDAGQLRQIAQPEVGFKWLGQKHYDALGDAIVEHLYRTMEAAPASAGASEAAGGSCAEHGDAALPPSLTNGFGLVRLQCPFDADASREPTIPIFASPNLDKYETVMVLCQGSGAVRPGMWARALCINDTLSTGSIFNYLRLAQLRGWGVIVLNPNENVGKQPAAAAPADAVDAAAAKTELTEKEVQSFWLSTSDNDWKAHCLMQRRLDIPVRDHTSPPEHAISVWRHLVLPCPAKHLVVVAHSYGGVCTTSLVAAFPDDFHRRVRGIVLTDAINGMFESRHMGMDRMAPAERRRCQGIMKALSRNWLASAKPLDAPLSSMSGCSEVSSGHTVHENTSASCIASAFAFLDEKLAVAAASPEEVA